MARIRGGRERPTASVRRGDRRDEAAEAGGFPSGPSDRSVLGMFWLVTLITLLLDCGLMR